jgi:hypothetical protein
MKVTDFVSGLRIMLFYGWDTDKDIRLNFVNCNGGESVIQDARSW